MAPDKQLLEAWENAVALGNAWLVFAYAKNRKRYRELQREGEHHGLQSHMERELVWRICDGDFQAFGIEHGSDAGPIPIPKYYFSKSVAVDWNRETIEAFGKKFHEVRVQGEREQEPADEARLSAAPLTMDPREISAQRGRELLRKTPSDGPESYHELPNQAEPESTNETPLSESATDGLKEAPSPSKVRGRPSKAPEIERAIDILLDHGVDLAKMPRPQAFKAVRKCAASELKSDVNIGFSDPVIQRALLNRFGQRR
jgi:hypothetical protein